MEQIDYNAQTVNATKWGDMTVNELMEQRNRLFDRYDFLVSKKKDVRAIIQGINDLDRLIAEKALP